MNEFLKTVLQILLGAWLVWLVFGAITFGFLYELTGVGPFFGLFGWVKQTYVKRSKKQTYAERKFNKKVRHQLVVSRQIYNHLNETVEDIVRSLGIRDEIAVEVCDDLTRQMGPITEITWWGQRQCLLRFTVDMFYGGKQIRWHELGNPTTVYEIDDEQVAVRNMLFLTRSHLREYYSELAELARQFRAIRP